MTFNFRPINKFVSETCMITSWHAFIATYSRYTRGLSLWKVYRPSPIIANFTLRRLKMLARTSHFSGCGSCARHGPAAASRNLINSQTWLWPTAWCASWVLRPTGRAFRIQPEVGHAPVPTPRRWPGCETVRSHSNHRYNGRRFRMPRARTSVCPIAYKLVAQALHIEKKLGNWKYSK